MTRFIVETEQVANTMAASIPIALDQAVRSGRINPGQTVLMCGLGAGVCWGAMIARL